MLVREDDFFREATIRICGSLDIKTALMSAFQYLMQFIPLDAIGLHLYEEGSNFMRSIAKVSESRASIFDRITPLTNGPSRIPALTKIVNHPELDPATKDMLRHDNPEQYSVLLMKLRLEGRLVGILALRAKGQEKYDDSHAKLLETLKAPFTIALSNALKHLELLNLKNRLVDDNQYLWRELQTMQGNRIIGENTGLKMVMAMARQVAPLNSPVLLMGETGVGKEIIANAIHYASPRKGGPFIKVNCGAIPDTLLDSELFGHEKGAFTGATSQKRGLFERAHEGTIFLDEVGELLPQAQVRMLRVLQEKEIDRVGGTKTIPVDIRLITATNRNLEEMVQTSLFRQDLWFRLNVFPIFVPPLRERKEDIPEFVSYLLSKKSEEMKLAKMPVLAAGALEPLMEYDWPGNVRELENIIERTLILNRGEPIVFRDTFIQMNSIRPTESMRMLSESLNMNSAIAAQISRALKTSGGKIHGSGGAAELLGMNPSTLRHRMRKLGLAAKL